MEPPAKRAQTSTVIQLQSVSGEVLGAPVDVPSSTTARDLEKLVRVLRKDTNSYAFYYNDVEIEELPHVTEETVVITFEALGVFRVRRVTRCGSTLPGHTDAILKAEFSHDGKVLATGSGDASVRLWDPLTGTPKSTLKGHKSHVLCVAWSTTGLLATGDRNGEVRIWDKATYKHKKWVTALVWHDGLLASASKDGTIKIWPSMTSLSGHSDSVEALAWAGDGRLYSGSRDRTVKVWLHGKLQETRSTHGHRVNCLALSTSFVLRTGGDYAAFVARTGPDRLASGSDDATIVLDKHRLTGHQQAVNDVKFSPDARFLASASFDKKIKLWHGRTGAFIATLSGHVAAVYGVSWSPDSRTLASASKDSTLKLWDPAQTTALDTLPGHLDEVFALDWAPSGLRLASGSKDRTLKLWQA